MADIHILVADDCAGQRLDAYLGANDGCPTLRLRASDRGRRRIVNGETCLSKSMPYAPVTAFLSTCPSSTIPPM